jgi:hypothetical protein
MNWVWTNKDARVKGRKLESILNQIRVSDILPETYVREDFSDHRNINHNLGRGSTGSIGHIHLLEPQ